MGAPCVWAKARSVGKTVIIAMPHKTRNTGLAPRRAAASSLKSRAIGVTP
jgi:hypothetical protein